MANYESMKSIKFKFIKPEIDLILEGLELLRADSEVKQNSSKPKRIDELTNEIKNIQKEATKLKY